MLRADLIGGCSFGIWSTGAKQVQVEKEPDHSTAGSSAASPLYSRLFMTDNPLRHNGADLRVERNTHRW